MKFGVFTRVGATSPKALTANKLCPTYMLTNYFPYIVNYGTYYLPT
jgi:hypothetical protein